MLSRSEPSFDAAYQGLDLPAGSTLIAAVSGGSDSVALLVSLSGNLARHRPDIHLVAVTIDHGLRAQSATEAGAVAMLCASLGVRHMTRRWTGDKPSTGIAAAARAARYRLLGDVGRETGAAAIVTGHTADDQAETIAMRLQRGAGRGLAGMASASLLDGKIWLLRPLLAERRDALRRFLRERNIGWADDPSNDDIRFERPRVRRELASRPGVTDLLVLGLKAALDRRRLGVQAGTLIGQLASRPIPGLLQIAPGMVKQPNEDAAIYALRILLAVAGGSTQLPDEMSTRALAKALAASSEHGRWTLSRSIIERRKHAIFVHRENRHLPDWSRLDDDSIWDGRYRIERAGDDDVPLLGALGRRWTVPPTLPSIPESILRAAQAVEPAVLFPGGQPQLLDAERLGVRAWPVAAPWAVLLPSFDLAPARAIAAILGAAIPPDPPYRGHSEGQA